MKKKLAGNKRCMYCLILYYWIGLTFQLQLN